MNEENPARRGRLHLLARCVRGLEWVSADEVSSTLPGASNLVMDQREVSFSLPELDPAVLTLRTVDDVFLMVGELGGVGTTKDVPPVVAKRLGALNWSAARNLVASLRALPTRPAFDVVASLEGKRNFNRFDVEHAVGTVVADYLGGSYLPRSADGRPVGEPDLSVRIFLRDRRVLAAVRLSRRPLHRREYKQDTGKGTLHPPLAAALSRLADPAPGQVFADPFCGDGTIPIEAALLTPGLRVHAGDLDPVRVANARRNAARAGVNIDFRQADAGQPNPTGAAQTGTALTGTGQTGTGQTGAGQSGAADILVTNPPWNVTVDGAGSLAQSFAPFWEQLPDRLTAEGRVCLITDSALNIPKKLQRSSFQEVLSIRIRIAGRVSHILLGAQAIRTRPQLPAGPAQWRLQALAKGTVDAEGF